MRFLALSGWTLIALSFFWLFFAHDLQASVTCSVGAIVLSCLMYVLNEVREVQARIDQAQGKESL